MIKSLDDLLGALAVLELRGGDTTSIEAKTFSEYSSAQMGPTMCAFANMPEGGVVLMGVSERDGINVVGVDDVNSLLQSAASQARNGFSPSIRVDVRAFDLDGKTVGVVNVEGADVNEKPVRWLKDKKAYLRQYDGDYQMSTSEEQMLLLRHCRPNSDAQSVPGSSLRDLDSELVNRYLASVRETTPRLVNDSDEAVLFFTGVVADRESGELSTAGLYALGEYPQRLLPHLTVTAAVEGTDDVRAVNRRDFTGALPVILDDVLDWVAQNVESRQVVTRDGHGLTDYAVPLLAAREVIANALVHRDLSEASRGKGIDLRITRDGFRLTNPGGLWGITVDRLGSGDHPAVNEHLYQICRNVEGRSGRVIEAMGTGIREVRRALQDAGMAEPLFFDNGVCFTVRFPNSALIPDGDLAWIGRLGREAAAGLNRRQKEALVDMRHGRTWSNGEYREHFGVTAEEARADLRDLVSRGLVTSTGQRRWVRYELAGKR
ncbi:RNA-binding domain-containing protein [Schaalia odontolytica]